MAMIMIVPMITVTVRMRQAFKLERSILSGVQPFDMMMVTFLCSAHLGLKAQNLRAVFAHLAVHPVVTRKDLFHALDKCINHCRMVVELGRLDEFDFGVACGHFIRGLINSVHQYSGEKKIGKYDDAFETEPCHMFKCWFN